MRGSQRTPSPRGSANPIWPETAQHDKEISSRFDTNGGWMGVENEFENSRRRISTWVSTCAAATRSMKKGGFANDAGRLIPPAGEICSKTY